MKVEKIKILCMLLLCVIFLSACKADTKDQSSVTGSKNSTEDMEQTETNSEELLTDVIELPEDSVTDSQDGSIYEDENRQNNGNESENVVAKDSESKENNTIQALGDVPEIDD